MTKVSPGAGRLLLWAVNTLLVLVFLAVGTAKFIFPEAWGDHFVNVWGLPPEMVSWVGWLEVGGAVLLLPRRTAVVGGSLLAVIMAGATVTHLLNAQWQQAPVSLALMVLAAWVAARRQDMAAMEGREVESESHETDEEGDPPEG